ncbi:MAG: restriction endonuclease subunit S, partial [Hymenobacter sp.]
YSLLELKKGLDKSFLYQALKGRESLIMDLRVGSGLPNIQQKAIKEFELSFPESIDEQRQIARVLSKVDEAISQTEQLIAKYRRLKTGLMQDLLTKGIDAHGNIRSEETHAFKYSPLGRIPVEWEVELLEKVCDVIDPNPSHRNPTYSTDGYPFVSTADFTKDGSIDLGAVRKVVESTVLEQEKRCKFNRNSLIISRKGTIGEVRFTPYPIRFALLDSVCVINPKSAVNAGWVYTVLNGPDIKKQLELKTKGVALQQVSLNEIRSLNLIVPNKDEQTRIEQMITASNSRLNELLTLASKLQSTYVEAAKPKKPELDRYGMPLKKDMSDPWEARHGIALAFRELAAIFPEDQIAPFLAFLIVIFIRIIYILFCAFHEI